MMTESLEQHVNTYSRPSQLKITDMRLVNLAGVPTRCSINRVVKFKTRLLRLGEEGLWIFSFLLIHPSSSPPAPLLVS